MSAVFHAQKYLPMDHQLATPKHPTANWKSGLFFWQESTGHTTTSNQKYPSCYAIPNVKVAKQWGMIKCGWCGLLHLHWKWTRDCQASQAKCNSTGPQQHTQYTLSSRTSSSTYRKLCTGQHIGTAALQLRVSCLACTIKQTNTAS